MNVQQTWEATPVSVQQMLGNSHKEYDKSIVQFSIRNQVSAQFSCTVKVFNPVPRFGLSQGSGSDRKIKNIKK